MNEYRVYKDKNSADLFSCVILPDRVVIEVSKPNPATGVLTLRLPGETDEGQVYLSANRSYVVEAWITHVYGSSELNGPIFASVSPGSIYLAGFGSLKYVTSGVRPRYEDPQGRTIVECIPIWRDSEIEEGLVAQVCLAETVSPLTAFIVAVGLSTPLFEPTNLGLFI